MNTKAIKEAINHTYENSKLERFYFYIIILLCTGIYFLIFNSNYYISIPILILEMVLLIIYCSEIKNRYKENLNNIIYLRDGNHVIFNKVNNSKENLNIKNGIREGVCEVYYNNDQIKIRTYYVNGIKEGVYEEYFGNGQIKIKSFYDKPKPIPLLVDKKFRLEDVISSKISLMEWQEQEKTFQNLKIQENQHGFQYEYNEDGILIQKSNFIDNIMVSFEEYYNNGKLRMMNFNETYCYYSEDNKKTCEIIVDKKTLKPKGVWINYNNDEAIDFELNFDLINENEDVLKINYDKSGNVISSKKVRINLSEYFEYYIRSFYCDNRFEGKAMALKRINSSRSAHIEITLDPISGINDFINIKNKQVGYIRYNVSHSANKSFF